MVLETGVMLAVAGFLACVVFASLAVLRSSDFAAVPAAPPIFVATVFSEAPPAFVASVVLRGCGAGRCAYCHDDVAVEDRAACAACLAVHHEECWEDRCAACGAALSLRCPVPARVL